jgi:hypothetical protein
MGIAFLQKQSGSLHVKLELQERDINIHIGHTDAYELWINGILLSKKTNVDWWTAENVHISNFHLNKGVNRIGLKLVRRTERADFSIAFLKTEGGMCGVMAFPEHYTDWASMGRLV